MQHQDNHSKLKSRELRNNTKVNEDLEKQFTEGLSNKLMNTKHLGLGCDNKPAFQNTRKTFDDDDTETVVNSVKPSEIKSYSSSNQAAESKLKFKKMSFVKSST